MPSRGRLGGGVEPISVTTNAKSYTVPASWPWPVYFSLFPNLMCISLQSCYVSRTINNLELEIVAFPFPQHRQPLKSTSSLCLPLKHCSELVSEHCSLLSSIRKRPFSLPLLWRLWRLPLCLPSLFLPCSLVIRMLSGNPCLAAQQPRPTSPLPPSHFFIPLDPSCTVSCVTSAIRSSCNSILPVSFQSSETPSPPHPLPLVMDGPCGVPCMVPCGVNGPHCSSCPH